MTSSPKSYKLTWVWFALLLPIVVCVIAFDPPSTLLGHSAGTVVVGFRKSRFGTGQATVNVRLSDGNLVVASAQADRHYPFQPGDLVVVTTYETLLFHRRQYQASYAEPGNGP